MYSQGSCRLFQFLSQFLNWTECICCQSTLYSDGLKLFKTMWHRRARRKFFWVILMKNIHLSLFFALKQELQHRV